MDEKSKQFAIETKCQKAGKAICGAIALIYSVCVGVYFYMRFTATKDMLDM